MTTITMSNTDIYLNETITSTIMNKNFSTSTTLIESSSLDDLCKNFHVSLRDYQFK
jgi:hypothetical protein